MATNARRVLLVARAALGFAGLVLITRAVVGPFRLLVSVQSPLTAEGVIALALLACLVIRAEKAVGRSADFVPHAAFAGILILVAACFTPALSNYFLSDDFLVLDFCKQYAPKLPLSWALVKSNSEHIFFRPVIVLSNMLECGWAGTEPVRWHTVDLAVHLINCAFVYFIAWSLLANRNKAAWAAAFFGIYPSNPEAVSWTGGGQDTLISALFVLATVKIYMAWLQHRRALLLAAALVASILAMGSKETGFVLVFLLAVIAIHQRARLRTLIPFVGASIAMFAYRWYVIGGFGGYPGSILRLTGAIKALGVRIWAILLFPMNWSAPVDAFVIVGIAAAVLVYATLTFSRPIRRDLLMTLFWVGLCAAPAVQTLLIGPDLLNSRQVYLSAAGFAMLLAGAVDDLPRLRRAAGTALLVFFFVALEHNQAIRARVSATARQICIDAAKGSKIGDPPHIIDGVWAFGNGFEQCVELQRH